MRTRRWAALAVTVAMIAVPMGAAFAQQPPPNSPDPEGTNPNITYRDAAGDVHVVRFQDQSNPSARADTGDFDISQPSWPKATGTPTGYASNITPGGPQEHVIYRAANGHLIELWKVDTDTTWNKTDLTSASGTNARAAGDAVSWSHDSLGRQWVVYRAVGGQIHGLTWLSTTSVWRDINLSAAAHTKALALSDPTSYIDSVSLTPRPIVLYRGVDKHVHLLVWTVGGSSLTWHDSDITALAHDNTGAPLGKPYGWVSEAPASSFPELHAVFHTANGHVHELYGGFGHPWKHNDLTVASSTNLLTFNDVQGTVGSDEFSDNFEAVLFRAVGGELNEFLYSATPSVPWEVHDQGVSADRVGLWFQDGFNSYTVYVQGGHLMVGEYEWFNEVNDTSDLTTYFSSTTSPATGTGGYFTPVPAM
jgi:hypothetical protein